MAFTSPRHPIWNKSSKLSVFPENFFRILSTNFRLPFISSSLAKESPSCIFLNNSNVSSLVNTFIFAVFTPLISTLWRDIIKNLLSYSL